MRVILNHFGPCSSYCFFQVYVEQDPNYFVNLWRSFVTCEGTCCCTPKRDLQSHVGEQESDLSMQILIKIGLHDVEKILAVDGVQR